MSQVQVVDHGGGQFGVVVVFSPEEGDRLPFNALTRLGARIESGADGGVRAAAIFDLRDPAAAGRFVEALAIFGDKGLYAQGLAPGGHA